MRGLPRPGLLPGLPRLRGERGIVRDVLHAEPRRLQGHPDKRWDTARIAALAEILGFYGLSYWYPMQVLVLGRRTDVAERQRVGAGAAAPPCSSRGRRPRSGLSEKEHGADIYSTDMVLTPTPDGGWTAPTERSTTSATEHGWHRVGLRANRRCRGPGPVRVVLRRQRAPELPRREERRAVADVRGASSGSTDYPVEHEDILSRLGRVRRRAEHRQRRQVQPVLRRRSGWPRTRSTRRSRTPTTACLYGRYGDRIPARPAASWSGRLSRARRHEALQRPGPSTTSARPLRRPRVPAVQPGHEDEGARPRARRSSPC